MAIDIGSTVEGTVVRLADYGAIVRLSGGKIGLVHISEIADTFVRDVREHLNENDRVFVKVLKLNDKGRYELSAKQADATAVQRPSRPPHPPRTSELTERDFQPERSRERLPVNFEDKLSRFLKDSEERQLDLKRHVEAKRGGRRK
jgi:S1 RNA binding domain protein